MQKLETRNGILWFVEVPENAKKFEITKLGLHYCLGVEVNKITPCSITSRYIIGEVTKEGITFDCEHYLNKLKYSESKEEIETRFITEMILHFIELREGYKFVVLKEKSQ